MNQRVLAPLSEAPAGALAGYIGECLDCDRPVGRRYVFKANPEYRQWLAPGTLSHPEQERGCICQSCALRRSRNYQPGSRVVESWEPRTRRPRVQLTDQQLISLRRMVGACETCGWAPDDGQKPHKPHTEG